MSKTMKQLIRPVAVLMAICIALLPAPAWAASVDPEIALKADGEGVSVAIDLPEGTDPDDMGAVQLSLRLNVVSGSLADATFSFDSSMTADVKEYVYHADTGLLTLYIAGGHNLFIGTHFSLGSVVLTASDDTGVRVEVSAVENSLKMVNNAYIESAPTIASIGSAEAIVGGGGTTPEHKPDPDPGNGEGGGGQGSGSDAGDTDSGLGSGIDPSASGVFGDAGKAFLLNTGDSLWVAAIACSAIVLLGAGTLIIAAQKRARP